MHVAALQLLVLSASNACTYSQLVNVVLHTWQKAGQQVFQQEHRRVNITKYCISFLKVATDTATFEDAVGRFATHIYVRNACMA